MSYSYYDIHIMSAYILFGGGATLCKQQLHSAS